jgi:hypothetical protein
MEEYVVRELGPRPAFDPVGNTRDAQIAKSQANRSELEELEEDERRIEDQLAQQPGAWGLRIGLVFAIAAEAFGSILVMKALGRENPERTILGVMLAVATVFFTGWVTERSARANNSARSRVGLFVLFAGYALFVAALAAVRVLEAAREETDAAGGAWAESVLMVAGSVLPALFSESLVRKLVPVRALLRSLADTQRRLKRIRAERAQAEAHLRALGKKQAEWDRAAAIRRAAYRAEHRIAASNAAQSE